MGLCKCPKRKVTNQFCFEHRVNVCEFCLTSGHPTCIVKSYLHWLQDSDFNPICTLCNEALANIECVRLTCYDVFHWDCLNREALKSTDSQSTEIKCPVCKANVVPPEKLVSPVADALRKKLATVAWGRKKLGLPVMAPVNSSQQQEQVKEDITQNPVQGITNASESGKRDRVTVSSNVAANHTQNNPSTAESINNVPMHQMNTPSSQSTYVREKFHNEASRRVPETKKEEEAVSIPFDHDDDKYRRKGLRHWLSGLFRLRKNVKYAPDDPNITFKRISVIILLVVLFFMTMIVILTRVGRTFADSDRHLDPKFNPNIRVSDGRT